MALPSARVSISRDRKNLIVEKVPLRYVETLKDWGGKQVGTGDAAPILFPRLQCYGNVLKRNGIHVPDGIFGSVPQPLEDSDNLKQFFPYQQEAVRFLVSSEHRGCLLALSQGLGKTAVSIEAAVQLGCKRILVVAPLTLLANWQKEIDKWASGSEVRVYRGGHISNVQWTVTNYEMIMRRIAEFRPVNWDLIIFDESIRLKTRGTETWNRAKKLVTPRMWLLSGSPISKDMTDLWAQFALMLPQYFKSYWRFANEYMFVIESEWGKSFGGSRDIDFRSEFWDIMHVVPQDEVLDLPEMTFQPVYVDLQGAQLKMYRDALHSFLIDLGNTSRPLPVMSRISQITRLQQIISATINIPGSSYDESVKHDATIDLLESGEVMLPVIIWVHWVPGARRLATNLARKGFRVSLVTGETEDREKQLGDFLADRTQVLVITSGTGKYGLTLTNARSMIYVDLSYNFDAYVQSLYRVRRIGLDHPVVVYTIIAQGTIDELIHDNLAGKSEDLAKVTDADLVTLLSVLDRSPA